MDEELEFKMATDIKYNWSAGEVSFDCPCGMWGIIQDADDEVFECECGRRYRVVHFVEVSIPSGQLEEGECEQ